MIIDPYLWHHCRIEAISRIASDTVSVRLQRPNGYQFRAGQYAVIRVTTADGKSYMRQYSFSSAPADEDLELLVQHEPSGVVTTWFCDTAKPGDTLELSQSFGNFTLEAAPHNRPVLLIAGRIGIAPFISMLRDKKHRKVSVLYSVRTEAQVCFPELLEGYRATIVRTETSPRISTIFLKKMIADSPLVYVCGSKQFVDSITAALYELGVPLEDVKRELFTLQ